MSFAALPLITRCQRHRFTRAITLIFRACLLMLFFDAASQPFTPRAADFACFRDIFAALLPGRRRRDSRRRAARPFRRCLFHAAIDTPLPAFAAMRDARCLPL